MSHMPNSPKRSRPWFRRGVVIALVLYWLTMFTATHVPQAPQPLPPAFTDKWQHYVAYAGLGFLLAAWRQSRRALTMQASLVLFAIAVLYGAFDEVTQPFFGRDAELLDWRSDIIGAASGIALCALILAAFDRAKRKTGEQEAAAR
jgi:VanZ family protein